MNRLTYKNPNGTWGMNNGYDMTKVPSKLYGALYKLKDYEETGLSPEQIIQLDEIYLEKCEEINKLKKEIKEKEEEFTIDTNVGNKDGWIPVDERLPEDKQQVLIKNWDHSVFPARYDENGKRFIDIRNGLVLPLILAWMPLPAPYKEKGEGEEMKEFTEKLISRLEEESYDMEICEEQFDMNRPYFKDVPYKMLKLEDVKTIISQFVEEYVPDTNVGKKDGWIPVEERLPDNNKYIMLSFSNFSLPAIGRYEEDSEGEAFYIGDEEESCVAQDMFVNAWRELPEPYKAEGE